MLGWFRTICGAFLVAGRDPDARTRRVLSAAAEFMCPMSVAY